MFNDLIDIINNTKKYFLNNLINNDLTYFKLINILKI